MRSVHTKELVLKTAAKELDISVNLLKEWCDEGKVKFTTKYNHINKYEQIFISIEEINKHRLPDGTRVCSQCKDLKTLDNFPKRVRWNKKCKKCFNKTCDKWRRKYLKSYYKNNQKSIRERNRFWKYKISKEEYYNLLEYQQNKCGICKTENPRGAHGVWSIDHDHVIMGHDGVRGILCGHCNSLLGMARDSIETLLSAIEYLKDPPANHVIFVKNKDDSLV